MLCALVAHTLTTDLPGDETEGLERERLEGGVIEGGWCEGIILIV
jgi:hypothetical protein